MTAARELAKAASFDRPYTPTNGAPTTLRAVLDRAASLIAVPTDGANGRLLGYAAGSPAWRTAAQAWTDLGVAPDVNLPTRLQDTTLDARYLRAAGPVTALGQSVGDGANPYMNAFFAGVVDIGRNAGAGDAVGRVGVNRTADGNAYIDMFTAATVTSASNTLRIIRLAGLNGAAQIQTVGTGGLTLVTQGAGPLTLSTNSTARLTISAAGVVSFALAPQVPSYTVGTLPLASAYPRGLIYVSDGAGGKRIAFSDATNWRWVGTEVVVS